MNRVNIIEIKDIHDEALDVYARLREPELLHYYEPEPGLFIAESPKVIKLALAAGYQPESFLCEARYTDQELMEIMEAADIPEEVPVFTAEESVLMNITGFKLTRGMLCAMRRRAAADPADVCRGAVRIAVLENVVNPTNVGAVMRSAAAMNMDAVLLTKDCCDPLYRRAIRVSMGTVFQIPWAYIDGDYMEFIKDNGFASVAMAIEDRAVDLNKTSFMPDDKLAVILGNEGKGLDPKTIESCDHLVKIPMRAGVDSLNVAAASAVAFYELGRK